MDFQKFDKIPRLSRDIVITEKIDGTNAQIYICAKEEVIDYFISKDEFNHKEESKQFIDKHCLYTVSDSNLNDDLLMFAGSRKKWLDISSKGDNFTFAKWVQANAEELIKLGEGRHYGEWYGQGIQRNYGLDEKRFALFNVGKWEDAQVRPKCCEVVPVIKKGEFKTPLIENAIRDLKDLGSKIAPGFMNPEGIVIYHTASGRLFKKTILNDEKPKEQVKKEKATSEKV